MSQTFKDLFYIFCYYLVLYSFHSIRTYTNTSSNFQLLTSCRRISPYPRHYLIVYNMVRLYGVDWLAPLPNPKLEDHLLSDGRDCLFNVLAATVHITILQFHYLVLLPVTHCDASNSISFAMPFHREYVPS